MRQINEDKFARIKWRRFSIIAGAILLGFFAVIVRLAWLQLYEGEALALKADRQHRSQIDVEGKRGVIYDRAMRELAVNLDMPSVYGVPAAIENPALLAKKISAEVEMDTQTLVKKLDNNRQFVWLRRRMPPDVINKIEEMNLKGIGIMPETKRFYPKRELSGHIIGFTDIDNNGIEGVEKYYEKYLRGRKGSIVLERDARRRAVLENTIREPQKGNDLILTMDEVIQHAMEKELVAGVTEHNAAGGVGIVMNPYTGEILAMSVYPRFNPNDPEEYKSGQWRNRAITDVYEPGSTFKLVVASAALEEGVLSPNEIVHDGSGSLSYGGGTIHDPHPTGRAMTFKEVIAHSSNVGTAKIGIRLGKDRLYKYAKAFGFGDKTGIDLPGEVRGIIRDPSTWSGRSLVTVSIGQEVGITPIQLITAISAIANGGWLVRPHIVSGIIDNHGNTGTIKPEIIRRVISNTASKKMTDMLKEVVGPDGTGKLADLTGFSVAGKTGTAQKIDPATGRYSSNRFISSFVGFVPAEAPEIAILVIIDEPKGVAWGGSVAAPVFKKVAEQSLEYLHIEPEKREKITIMAENGEQK
ncbi:MAG: penicillin-binding protein 2 [Nitrospirae bacterium]|nr:penicillin-binding protein 2 [Nitrospirota bacterium]